MGCPLAQFVLFSSIAALTGPPGSSNYAAANAALDAAASALQASGLCGASVQWGAWSEVGMVSGSRAVQRAMERAGIGMVAPTAGLAAMAALTGAACAPGVVAAIPFRWRRFMQLHNNSAAPLYGEFARPASNSPQAATATAVWRDAAALAPAVHVVAAEVLPLAEIARSIGQAILAVHGAEVSSDEPLVQAGLDSLGECGCHP